MTVAFLSQNVLLVHAVEQNLWAERRRALEQASSRRDLTSKNTYARLPTNSLQSILPQVSAGLGQTALPRLPQAVGTEHAFNRELPGWMESIVSGQGAVQEVRFPAKPAKHYVVHIQDLHEAYEAQKNIAGLLEKIASSLDADGARSLLIGVEGAAGAFDLAPYRRLASPETVQKVSDLMVRQSLFSGAEYFGVTTPTSAKLWGVEDPAAYKANVKAFRESLRHQHEDDAALKAWETALDEAKATLYPAEFLAADREMTAYRRGETGLGVYARALAGRLDASRIGPNVKTFLKALELEEAMDFKRVEQERVRLIEALVETLAQADLEHLLKTSLTYRLGQSTYRDYYEYLRNVCSTHAVPMNRFSEFDTYIKYILLAERIDRGALMDEISAMEDAVAARLLSTEDQRALHRVASDLRLAERLNAFSFSSDEWNSFAGRRADIEALRGRMAKLSKASLPDLAGLFRRHEAFYVAADERNDHLVRNLLEQLDGAPARSVSVLIAGGFHSEGLRDALLRRDAAYISITPRVSAVDGLPHYLDPFRGERTSLDKLFSGERLFLKRAHLTAPNAPELLVDLTPRGTAQALYAQASLAFELMRRLGDAGAVTEDVRAWAAGFGQAVRAFDRLGEFEVETGEISYEAGAAGRGSRLSVPVAFRHADGRRVQVTASFARGSSAIPAGSLGFEVPGEGTLIFTVQPVSGFEAAAAAVREVLTRFVAEVGGALATGTAGVEEKISAPAAEEAVPQAERRRWFAAALGDSGGVLEGLKGRADGFARRVHEILHRAVHPGFDVRDNLIRALRDRFGDKYLFYPGGFGSIDIAQKVDKSTALTDLFNRSGGLDFAIYFGDEFYKSDKKTGNDTPVLRAKETLALQAAKNDTAILKAQGALGEQGKGIVVFSIDKDPDARTDEAKESTVWVGVGPEATKEVLAQIQEALRAGAAETVVRGKGPDAHKSVTIDLARLTTKGALIFDVDGTILETKKDNFSNQPEIRGVFEGLLTAGVNMGIISGNARKEQTDRIAKYLLDNPRIDRLFLYVNGGATRVQYDAAGKESTENLAGSIPREDIEAISEIMAQAAKTDFGLSAEQALSWKMWYQFDGTHGHRPDFPGVNFRMWDEEGYRPTVVDADEVTEKVHAGAGLEMTAPWVEVRDGVQLSIKLLPKSAAPNAGDWAKLVREEYAGDPKLAPALDALISWLDNKQKRGGKTWAEMGGGEKADVFRGLAREAGLSAEEALVLAGALGPVRKSVDLVPGFYEELLDAAVWGTETPQGFRKSEFRVAVEKLLGVEDIVKHQRMSDAAAVPLAKEALRGIRLKLDRLGLDAKTVSQEEFNAHFAVQPIAVAAGYASRFSKFQHKVLARNGQGKTNIRLAVEGSYRNPGVPAVIVIGDKALSRILKAEYVEGYDEAKGGFKLKKDFRARIAVENIITEDSPFINRERMRDIFGEGAVLYFEPQPRGHGDHLVVATHRLHKEGLLKAPFVQVTFGEMAEASLPKKSNASFVTYLKMVSGDYLAVSGGKDLAGANIKVKGNFFFNGGRLVSYTDWEQIPHSVKGQTYDEVQKQVGPALERLQGELAALNERRRTGDVSVEDYQRAIRAYREQNPYLLISDEGVLFTHDGLVDVAAKVARWSELEQGEKDFLKRHYAIVDKGETADLLISANVGIFRADEVVKLHEQMMREYEENGFREFDEQLAAGTPVDKIADRRKITAFWGVDWKTGESKSLAWNLIRIIVSNFQRENPGKTLPTQFVYVGEAPSSVKDPPAQAKFTQAYLKDAKVPPLEIGAAARALADDINAGRKAEAAVKVAQAVADLDAYQDLMEQAFAATADGRQDILFELLATLEDVAAADDGTRAVESARAPPALLKAINKQIVIDAIDSNRLGEAAIERSFRDNAFRAVFLRFVGPLYSDPKSGFIAQKINEIVRPLIRRLAENAPKLPALSVKQIKVLALTGGTAAAALLGPALRIAGFGEGLKPGEVMMLPVVSHVDDGGSTFKISQKLWEAGYGILPPVGDQVNALFAAFATQDKIEHILGDAGRIREDGVNSSAAYLDGLLAKTLFDGQLAMNPDFLSFARDMRAALERVDRELIDTGVLPTKGASLRNLYLVGKLLEKGLISKGAPADDKAAITIEKSGRYQAGLNEIAGETGITNGAVSLNSFDADTIYARHEDHVLFVRVPEGTAGAETVKLAAEKTTPGAVEENGKYFKLNYVIPVGLSVAGGKVRAALNAGPSSELRPGQSLEVAEGVTISNENGTAVLGVGEDRFEVREDVSRLSLKLVARNREISIARDGSGRSRDFENLPSRTKGEIDWISAGGREFLFRSRFIIMQTHITETVNLSRIEGFGLLTKKAGLASGSFDPEAVPAPAGKKSSANAQIINYIQNVRPGEMILFGPGSIFTSLLPHLMTEGVVEALADAKKRGVNVVFIVNGNYDNETVGNTIAGLLGMLENAAGMAFDEFISDLIVTAEPPEKSGLLGAHPVDRFLAGEPLVYGPIFQEWLSGLKAEGVRDQDLAENLRQRFDYMIKSLNGQRTLEIRTDAAAASEAAKKAYGPMVLTDADRAFLSGRNVRVLERPLLSLRTSVSRETGKKEHKVGYSAVQLAEALKEISGESGRERRAASVLASKMWTPLKALAGKAADFLKGGYGQPGYGVEDGTAVDGSHALAGAQGYYAEGGRDAFVGTVESMRAFFKRRAERNGAPIRLILKPGIGGQHTPFQGIASVFEVFDAASGKILGEYELGKDFEGALQGLLDGMGIGWDQVAVIPSSKSGSTDETMMVFERLLFALLKGQAEARRAGSGDKFARLVFDTLHELNFTDGKERPGADLFKVDPAKFGTGSLLKLVQDRATAASLGLDAAQVGEIFGKALGNMFFETTDRASQSRLSAFVRNSGLDKDLGEDAPGFGAMFDNVGGRWTADLHMMTFLAFYGTPEMTEAYWEARRRGIESVRRGSHAANRLANKILDEGITDIALVVPDELFWFGKSIEQNFNESVWQDGFATIVTVKQSQWNAVQQRHYARADRLVINLTDMDIPERRFKVVKVAAPSLTAGVETGKALAMAELSTTFYGMTNTVGNRLIARAIRSASLLALTGQYRAVAELVALEGAKEEEVVRIEEDLRRRYDPAALAAELTVEKMDLNDLGQLATRIFQKNLYLRQPYVELGKGLLEERLKKLQADGGLAEALKELQRDAERGALRSNVPGMDADSEISDVRTLARALAQAAAYAKANGRRLVPFLYLEGDKFQELRDRLTVLGYEWVLQGTGDQHINYQQVLAQPQKFLPFVVSMTPAATEEGLPAIGFAKGYLHRVSPHMVRDFFAEASYRALVERRGPQGGMGVFVRLRDSALHRRMLREAAEDAAETAFGAWSVGSDLELLARQGAKLAEIAAERSLAAASLGLLPLAKSLSGLEAALASRDAAAVMESLNGLSYNVRFSLLHHLARGSLEDWGALAARLDAAFGRLAGEGVEVLPQAAEDPRHRDYLVRYGGREERVRFLLSDVPSFLQRTDLHALGTVRGPTDGAPTEVALQKALFQLDADPADPRLRTVLLHEIHELFEIAGGKSPLDAHASALVRHGDEATEDVMAGLSERWANKAFQVSRRSLVQAGGASGYVAAEDAENFFIVAAKHSVAGDDGGRVRAQGLPVTFATGETVRGQVLNFGDDRTVVEAEGIKLRPRDIVIVRVPKASTSRQTRRWTGPLPTTAAPSQTGVVFMASAKRGDFESGTLSAPLSVPGTGERQIVASVAAQPGDSGSPLLSYDPQTDRLSVLGTVSRQGRAGEVIFVSAETIASYVARYAHGYESERARGRGEVEGLLADVPTGALAGLMEDRVPFEWRIRTAGGIVPVGVSRGLFELREALIERFDRIGEEAIGEWSLLFHSMETDSPSHVVDYLLNRIGDAPAWAKFRSYLIGLSADMLSARQAGDGRRLVMTYRRLLGALDRLVSEAEERNFLPFEQAVSVMDGKTLVEATMELALTKPMLDRLEARLRGRGDIPAKVAEALRASAMSTSVGGIGPLLKERLRPQAALGPRVVGVSLLYDKVWFQRKRTENGVTRLEQEPIPVGDFLREILDDAGEIDIEMFDGSWVKAKVWKAKAGDYGEAEAYFLDFPSITNVVYPGGADVGAERMDDVRDRQSWLLGRGMLALMKSLDRSPDLVVMSEAPTVFAHHRLVRDGFQEDPFFAGTRYVFNDHTPLEYAHPKLPYSRVERLRIDPRFFHNLPFWSRKDGKDVLDLTALIISAADGVYGVAKKHGEVMRAMPMLKAFARKIQAVTNGVSALYWPIQWIKELLVRLRGLRPDPERMAELLAGEEFGRALAQKQEAKDALVDLLGTRVDAPTDLDDEARAAWIERWKDGLRANDRPIVVWTRRVVQYKRLERFVDVIADEKMREAFLASGIVFVLGGRMHQDDGYGPGQFNRLQGILAADPRLRERVVFFDNYNIWEAPALFRGADASVMLADDGREASATGFQKAQMNGGLVIASDDGAVPESVVFGNGWNDDRANGFHVPYNANGEPTKEGLLNGLLQFAEVYRDPARRKQYVFNAFARSRQVSVDRTAEDAIRLYARVLASRDRAGSAGESGRRAAEGVLRAISGGSLERLVWDGRSGFDWNVREGRTLFVGAPGLEGARDGLRRMLSVGTAGEWSLLYNAYGAAGGGFFLKHLTESVPPTPGAAGYHNYLGRLALEIERAKSLRDDETILNLHAELLGFLDALVAQAARRRPWFRRSVLLQADARARGASFRRGDERPVLGSWKAVAASLADYRRAGFDLIYLLGATWTGELSRRISRGEADDKENAVYVSADPATGLPSAVVMAPFAGDASMAGSPFAVRLPGAINAELGSEADFKDLVGRARTLGLRLIVDFVPNHVAADSPLLRDHLDWFIHRAPRYGAGEDAREVSDEALLRRHPDHFVFYRVPGERTSRVMVAHGKDPNYPGWTDTAQLDYAQPALRAYMIEALRKLAALGVDGVRVDMAMLTLSEHVRSRHPGEDLGERLPEGYEFWREAVSAVKATHPEFFFLAETYWGKEGPLLDLGFDAVYDKYFLDLLQKGDVAELYDYLKRVPAEYLRRVAHFLENHDEDRARRAFALPNGSLEKLKAALVLLNTLPGLPFYHEGQSEGRAIKKPAQRVVPEEEAVDSEAEAVHAELVSLGKEALFRDGALNLLETPGARMLAYVRETPAEGSLVVVNYADRRQTSKITLPESWRARIRPDRYYALEDRYYDLKSDAARGRDGARPVYFVSGRELLDGLYVDLESWDAHIFRAPREVEASAGRPDAALSRLAAGAWHVGDMAELLARRVLPAVVEGTIAMSSAGLSLLPRGIETARQTIEGKREWRRYLEGLAKAPLNVKIRLLHEAAIANAVPFTAARRDALIETLRRAGAPFTVRAEESGEDRLVVDLTVEGGQVRLRFSLSNLPVLTEDPWVHALSTFIPARDAENAFDVALQDALFDLSPAARETVLLHELREIALVRAGDDPSSAHERTAREQGDHAAQSVMLELRKRAGAADAAAAKAAAEDSAAGIGVEVEMPDLVPMPVTEKGFLANLKVTRLLGAPDGAASGLLLERLLLGEEDAALTDPRFVELALGDGTPGNAHLRGLPFSTAEERAELARQLAAMNLAAKADALESLGGLAGAEGGTGGRKAREILAPFVVKVLALAGREEGQKAARRLDGARALNASFEDRFRPLAGALLALAGLAPEQVSDDLLRDLAAVYGRSFMQGFRRTERVTDFDAFGYKSEVQGEGVIVGLFHVTGADLAAPENADTISKLVAQVNFHRGSNLKDFAAELLVDAESRVDEPALRAQLMGLLRERVADLDADEAARIAASVFVTPTEGALVGQQIDLDVIFERVEQHFKGRSIGQISVFTAHPSRFKEAWRAKMAWVLYLVMPNGLMTEASRSIEEGIRAINYIKIQA